MRAHSLLSVGVLAFGLVSGPVRAGVALVSSLREVGTSSTNFGFFDQAASRNDSGTSGGTPYSFTFTTRQVSNITPDLVEYQGIGTITGFGPGPNGEGLRSLLRLVFDIAAQTPVRLENLQGSSADRITLNGSALGGTRLLSPGRHTLEITSFSTDNFSVRVDLPSPGAAALLAVIGAAGLLRRRRHFPA